MSLARSSPSYGTQPYPTALLDTYRSIKLYCELFGGRFHYRPRQSRPSCQPRGFLSIPRPATRRPHLFNGVAPGRSRIATGSALRATVVFRRFARLGLAACAKEWYLNAAPHILRELYRQLQARSSPPLSPRYAGHSSCYRARKQGHRNCTATLLSKGIITNP